MKTDFSKLLFCVLLFQLYAIDSVRVGKLYIDEYFISHSIVRTFIFDFPTHTHNTCYIQIVLDFHITGENNFIWKIEMNRIPLQETEITMLCGFLHNFSRTV